MGRQEEKSICYIGFVRNQNAIQVLKDLRVICLPCPGGILNSSSSRSTLAAVLSKRLYKCKTLFYIRIHVPKYMLGSEQQISRVIEKGELTTYRMEKFICVHTHTHTHTYAHMYICMYVLPYKLKGLTNNYEYLLVTQFVF